MKKFLIVALCIMFVMSISFINNKPVFKDYADYYEICLYNNSSSGTIISVNKNDFWKHNFLMGESFNISPDKFDFEKFVKDFNGQVVYTENTDYGVSYYLKADTKYEKEISGRRINMQIFIGNNQVTVGSPIIFGSY